MHRWFRTTGEVPLMSKTYVGEVFPRTVLFLNTEASIAAGQEVPVGDTEMYPYSETERVGMMPICFHDHPTLGSCVLYILAELADKSSPNCRMEQIEKFIVPA